MDLQASGSQTCPICQENTQQLTAVQPTPAPVSRRTTKQKLLKQALMQLLSKQGKAIGRAAAQARSRRQHLRRSQQKRRPPASLCLAKAR